ncbi:MAG: nucleotidyltransferase domain-containing protein, partial [Phycisphaerales bacterium]|nr:nucleotidyltransferase domain-containing protein [Phycisphaerales bacterium]
AEFCRKWDIVRLEVFGSALRDDFGPKSDLDFLITFAPESRHGLLDLIAAEEELEEMLGRPVDLMTRAGIESSRNWIRRREILESARLLYAA